MTAAADSFKEADHLGADETEQRDEGEAERARKAAELDGDCERRQKRPDHHNTEQRPSTVNLLDREVLIARQCHLVQQLGQVCARRNEGEGDRRARRTPHF
jgi:hypothetical protein